MSTAAFLAAVQAGLALFQVGYRNRYRHPKAEVYGRYGAQLEVGEYRPSHARHWYGR